MKLFEIYLVKKSSKNRTFQIKYHYYRDVVNRIIKLIMGKTLEEYIKDIVKQAILSGFYVITSLKQYRKANNTFYLSISTTKLTSQQVEKLDEYLLDQLWRLKYSLEHEVIDGLPKIVIFRNVREPFHTFPVVTVLDRFNAVNDNEAIASNLIFKLLQKWSNGSVTESLSNNVIITKYSLVMPFEVLQPIISDILMFKSVGLRNDYFKGTFTLIVKSRLPVTEDYVEQVAIKYYLYGLVVHYVGWPFVMLYNFKPLTEGQVQALLRKFI